MDYANNTNQDDLSANLQNYSIQLQQVNLALTSDPNNEEMLKLKEDLEEVINLTKELIQQSKPTSLATTSSLKAGQRVLAPYSVDGLYYEARVDDITSDGQCTVFFSSNVLPEASSKTKGISEVCLTSLLKPLTSSGGGNKSWDNQRASSSSKSSSSSHSRESLKKKQQKRQTKIKELEEEREKDKAKWQSFAKKKKISNKSIFSSPDSVEGRVGVGTCGISGKPMTSYSNSSSSVGSVPVKKKALSSGFPSSTSTGSSKNQ